MMIIAQSFIIPRQQQLINPVDLVIGDAGEVVCQPCLRINVIELYGFREFQSVKLLRSARRSAMRAAAAACRDRAQGRLWAVIRGQATVRSCRFRGARHKFLLLRSRNCRRLSKNLVFPQKI